MEVLLNINAEFMNFKNRKIELINKSKAWISE